MTIEEKQELKRELKYIVGKTLEPNCLLYLLLHMREELNQDLVSAAELHAIEAFKILQEAIEKI